MSGSEKSDLEFLNIVRAVLRLEPLHSGVNGEEHHNYTPDPYLEDIRKENKNSDEVYELLYIMSFSGNGGDFKYRRKKKH